MKVILSRKGFDSTYGGQPSPVLPDGTLLSLPIPSKSDNVMFSDLKYSDKSYYNIIKELKPGSAIRPHYTCHLDPDIRSEIIERPPGWKGLFGQKGSAQGHLVNEKISIGDLFLFFGWFKETELNDGNLQYIRKAPDLHVIYGYMQIGSIFNSAESLPESAKYHPHADYFNTNKNNALYEAAESLSFNSALPGSGCLSFNPHLILTKKDRNKSQWELPDFFKDLRITYHTKDSFKDGYFDSAKKGQEFVIEDNDKLTEWVKSSIIPRS
jgi:hypothetical protein